MQCCFIRRLEKALVVHIRISNLFFKPHKTRQRDMPESGGPSFIRGTETEMVGEEKHVIFFLHDRPFAEIPVTSDFFLRCIQCHQKELATRDHT